MCLLALVSLILSPNTFADLLFRSHGSSLMNRMSDERDGDLTAPETHFTGTNDVIIAFVRFNHLN